MRDSFAGLGTLLAFALRRDRIRLALWILGLAIAIAATAVTLPGTYPTDEARLGALLTMNNPGTTALIGKVYGDGDYTYGIMVGHQLLAATGVFAALMSIFTVVRHTRGEEESGRAELVRSAVVGRHMSALSAALLVIGANLLLALLLTVGLGSPGIDTIDWRGATLFGAAVATVGLAFGALAAITVQLTESARMASSIAGLVLAGAYLLRAIGDTRIPWVSWLSPFGWMQETRPFYENNWAPLLLLLALTLVLFAAAIPLGRRRDLGAGLFVTAAGPAHAGRTLSGALGLAWRLNRGVIIGWSAAMFTFGITYGPVLSEADSFLSDLPIMADILPDLDADGVELFGSLVIAIAAILCAIPALQIVLRLRSEEVGGRGAFLLTLPLSRTRLALSSAALATLAATAILLVFGLGMGLGAGLSMDDLTWIGRSISAALAYLPAVMTIIGLGMLLLGIAPRAVAAAWAGVVYSVLMMYFGGILQLPQWVMNVSPFEHIPKLPAADLQIAPFVWLTLISIAATVAGLLALQRRDIDGG